MINMLKEQVLNTIKKYDLINENDKIICGVSGGPDSICMLDILKDLKEDLKFEIVVCHINHLIREEAISDEEYVVNYCKENNIKCYVKRIDVKKYANNNKQGTEEAGRTVRYEFFEEILQKESTKQLWEAIHHLKGQQKEVILLQYFGDFSQKEIAAMLRLTTGSVKMLAYRAKKELKKYLISYQEGTR